jgi:5'-methylthioadenosine phosphorylase
MLSTVYLTQGVRLGLAGGRKSAVPEPQHIKAKKGDIAERVVISGDPARVAQLSGILKHRKLVNENRGFLTYTGEYDGKRVTVACHGVGAPSVAIVVEELIMLGAEAIVRLGTCGGLLKPMRIGDLVIATSAGYMGGTLDYYYKDKKLTPKPDARLTDFLVGSAKSEGIKYYTGPVFSADAFYAEDPGFVGRLARRGYVAVEMECATLFGLGMLRKVKTACVLSVSDNLSEAQPMVDAEALRQYVARAGKIVLKSPNLVQT